MDIAIIGGGAAGFFAAIQVKEMFPNSLVTIYEKSQNILSKVKISGGGRCNVTNGAISDRILLDGYPRGKRLLKKAFKDFNNRDAVNWFEEHGVPLYTQNDNRVFPTSNKSQSIINCFLSEIENKNIQIKLSSGIKSINKDQDKIVLSFINDSSDIIVDKVIIGTGGSPNVKSYNWLKELGHEIIAPVPSLFSFNIPNKSLNNLMGISVENALIKIPGTKLTSQGPLLATHWGLSGPAILKLSSYGALLLNERNYSFEIIVNWINEKNQEFVYNNIESIVHANPKKQLVNIKAYQLPERLWIYLINKAGLTTEKNWQDLGKKGINSIVRILTNDNYTVKGKTTFKEEFVTCGGVSLESIDHRTMQSKVCEGVYFAGEVLDLDGITGGYNFQAAWTTAFIAGKLGIN